MRPSSFPGSLLSSRMVDLGLAGSEPRRPPCHTPRLSRDFCPHSWADLLRAGLPLNKGPVCFPRRGFGWGSPGAWFRQEPFEGKMNWAQCLHPAEGGGGGQGPGQSSFQKASCPGMRRGLATMPMAESCGCILTPQPSHHSSDSHSLCQGEPWAGQRWPWTNTSDCNTCAFILRYTR